MIFKSMLLISLVSLMTITPITVLSQNVNSMSPNSITSQGPEDDAAITRSITEEIKASKVLSKLPVTISTTNGIVTITGNVDSDGQASMLIQLAESIIGVSDVDASKLVIKKSSQPFTDMAITAKVKGLFIKEKLFGDKDIAAINLNVVTNNGIVYLSGDVDNNDQIKNAIEIIRKNVSGVKSVEYRVRKTVITHPR